MFWLLVDCVGPIIGQEISGEVLPFALYIMEKYNSRRKCTKMTILLLLYLRWFSKGWIVNYEGM